MSGKREFEGKTAELQSLCSSITDCHHSTPSWTCAGWIVIRSENIKNGRISLDDPSFTDEASFRERTARRVPQPGDLIITREAPMGEIGMIPDGVACCLGQRQVLIKPDAAKVNKHYLLYAMQSPFVQKQIDASDSTGSTVSNLRIPLLKELAIPLVGDEASQQEIAAVLSSLDAKIDLNKRINAELESLAKTIYDYWFVQFDFPDANGRPYKTSGGKMVWNEALKREIPASWDVRTLGSLVPVSTATVDPGAESEKLFRHLSIPGLDACGSFLVERGREIGSNKFSIAACDLLVSKLNPWFNRVFADTSHDDLICSTEFVVWRCSTNDTQAYLHSIATSPSFIAYCTGSATGTSNSHKRINPQVMMRYQLAYAELQAAKFGEVAAPILEQRIRHTQQNRELTRLRDWLLPLLMNGQVRVAG